MESRGANKRVRGTTPITFNGIKFKSTVEMKMYKRLIDEGFKPEYEPASYRLWEGIKPTIPLFSGHNSKDLKLVTSKLIDITYTPDFYLEYKDMIIIIEVKGYRNDVFPYKFKMFRKALENYYYKGRIILFEIYSMKQLAQAIDIIHGIPRDTKEDLQVDR